MADATFNMSAFINIRLTFVLLGLFHGYAVHATSSFERGEVVSSVRAERLEEISGVAASRRHRGVLYVVEDAGNKNEVYALNITDGKKLATIDLKGADNCDWEDLAVGPGPAGESYIYVGDIGGNTDKDKHCQRIYRLPEPEMLEDADIRVNDSIRFKWSEGDAETLMVDPSGNVYIVNKVDPGQSVNAYMIPSSAWGPTSEYDLTNKGVQVNIRLGTNKDPVGGDISMQGNRVLLKTQTQVFLYNVEPGKSILDALQTSPENPPYQEEPQGESICWDSNGNGYYTIGEAKNANIWYYRESKGVIGEARRISAHLFCSLFGALLVLVILS